MRENKSNGGGVGGAGAESLSEEKVLNIFQLLSSWKEDIEPEEDNISLACLPRALTRE